MGCNNTAVIAAPVDTVWAALRNFHDLSWGAGVIESADAVGDKGPTEAGAKRVLNGAFHETLISLDDAKHTLTYSIDDGPAVLSKDSLVGYVGTVKATASSGSETTVEWTSEWESGEDGVADFCNPIYQALLGALQSHYA